MQHNSLKSEDIIITSMPEPRNFTVVFVVSILFKIRIRNCSRLRLWLHTRPGLNESDRWREIGVVVKYCCCTMSCEIFSRLRKSSENCCDVQKQRDGIHGGYRFSFHIRSPRMGQISSLPGGYSGVNFDHLKSEVFHLGWVGGWWWLGGLYSGVNFGHLKSEVFHWGGGLFGLKFQKGAFWRIWTQFLLFEECVHKPACASQIVSHILRMWRLMTFWKKLSTTKLGVKGSSLDFGIFSPSHLLPHHKA